MVDQRENENMSLEDIIKENSWFMWEKCDKNRNQGKVKKIHTIKTHSEVYEEGINVAGRAGLCKSKCNICGHTTDVRSINNHIREAYEDYLKEGLLRTSIFKEIYFDTWCSLVSS